jgi:hypothetical protein
VSEKGQNELLESGAIDFSTGEGGRVRDESRDEKMMVNLIV